MKTIGLIGGMSWESSAVYYEIINREVQQQLGGFHSARCILYSVDFAQIEELQHQDNWEQLNREMATAAQNLEKAGAELIVLCTNTMHLCSEAITRAISSPFLHIADATGMAIKAKGLKKVALLGTRFTMEKDFYKGRLYDKFGIEVIVPDAADRETIHRVIYDELVHGKVKAQSREKFRNIIKKTENAGAEGVILGCTEIPLLIKDTDVAIPVFDTTRIHAEKAVELALE